MKHFLKHYITWLFVGLGLTNLVALLQLDFWHIGAAFAGVYTLLVPGLLVLSFLVKKKLPLALGIALSAALSIALLMAAGLFINTVFPWTGVMNPLSPLKLVATFDVMMLVLLGIHIWHWRPFPLELPKFSRLDQIVAGGAVLMPILAVLGTTSLNNGGSNLFTMFSIGLVASYVPLLVYLKRRVNAAVLPIVLYMMALALLLMNSMRGWFITGHDVLREYHIFQMTDAADRWNAAAFRDPYNACLSITLLPTYLQSFLHIDPAYIYKFVFQFIGAMPIVPIFYMFLRYSSNIIAFLAAFTYISFPAFMVDMSMLNRQSVAFLFFSLLLYALLTNFYIIKRQRTILLFLLGTSMIVSHYSTSYVGVTMLVIGYLISGGLRLTIGRKGRFGKVRRFMSRRANFSMYRQPTLLVWPFVLVMFAMVVAWNGPITQTSKGVAKTLQGIGQSLRQPFNQDTTGPGTTKYSIVAADKTSKDAAFQKFVAEGLKAERTPTEENNLFPLNVTRLPQYKANAIDEPRLPTGVIGSALERLPVKLHTVFDLLKQGYAKILQILLLVGLAGMVVGYTFKRKIIRRIPLEYLALSVAGMMMIAFQVLVPQSGIDYGVLRLFQQELMLLALPVVLGFVWLVGFVFHKITAQFFAYGGLVVAFFLILSGFVPQLTGGGRPALALNNSGFYYDAYYTRAQEVASFKWLKQTAKDPHYIVQSDRFFTALKLYAYTSIPGGGSRLLPETIKRNSFVILSTTNMEDGMVIEYQNGDILYYKLPVNFLSDNKNLIYSTGNASIYW